MSLLVSYRLTKEGFDSIVMFILRIAEASVKKNLYSLSWIKFNCLPVCFLNAL